MKKKLFLIAYCALTLLAICLLLSSCGGGASGEKTVLYVYNWGEYIEDGSGTEDGKSVNDLFEEYCRDELGLNVEVNYSTFSSNEDMFAKIDSGSVAYDVIIPSDYMIERMIKEKLIRPLNLDLIPNYETNIDPRFKGENIYYETGAAEGELYSVPYFYGMIGVIYNTSIVAEDDKDLGSWSLMWDEDYRGDILQFNNNRDAFGTALYYLGYDVNNATEAQWREALELLKQQKGVVQGYVMDEIFNKMKSGSAAVSAYYAGDFLSMYEGNDDLAFFYPQEGTNSYVDAMCIPHNSQNVDLAHHYINFMCSEDIAIMNAEYTYYASPVVSVIENEEYREYMESVHEDAMEILYGDMATSVKTQAYLNLSDDKLTMLNNLWEELKVESSIGKGIYVLCGVIVAGLVTLAVKSFLRRRRWAKLYD